MLIYVRDANGVDLPKAYQPNQLLKIPSRPNNQGPDIQHGPNGPPPRLPPPQVSDHGNILWDLIKVMQLETTHIAIRA